MRNSIFIFFILLVLASCKSEPQDTQDPNAVSDSIAFQKPLVLPQQEVKLDSTPRNIALKWVEFITAENEIRNLRGSKVIDVADKAPAITEIMQSLKASLPDTLRSNAVESRLTVVLTKSLLLKQFAGQREPDAKKIEQTTTELYSEFNNLKRQMNEKFLKTLEDFEEELDKFEEEERKQRELDSITQLRTNDSLQKNSQQ